MTSAREHGTPLSVGDEVELDITDIAHGGICVARHEGRVVFVSDAIPGERVRARITEARKKAFARASTIAVIDASPDRREHVWAAAAIDRDPTERAGGAEFGHIALDRQRRLKAQVLVDAMQRFGGVELTPEEGDDAIDMLDALVESAPGDDDANGLGYRTRVRLHVDPSSGAVGPYAARSKRVVPLDELPLAVEAVNRIAPLTEPLLGVETVDVIAPSADDPRVLLRHGGERSRVGESDAIIEQVSGHAFRIRAGGFWQVHREAPELLFGAVREAVADLAEAGRVDPGAANLDLYGGSGLLAAAMADAVGPALKVTSVESVEQATDDAAENLSGLVGALAVTQRVDRYLSELAEAPRATRERLQRATVVLDPPRSGAGADVAEQLAALGPANIVYVACDPVALARDTKVLRDAGYALTGLRAFDIFPHTHHFESVAVFERD